MSVPFRSGALGTCALLAATPLAAAQAVDPDVLLSDHATAPEVTLRLDLTRPVYEPVPPGGFAAPDPRLLARPSVATNPAPKAEGAVTASATIAGGVDRLLTAPLVDTANDGSLWVRTRHLRTHFEDGAVTAYPVFGRRSPQEWPVRFALRDARVGGAPFALAASRVTRSGDVVTLDHGSVREVWNLGVEAIEQTFVFDELPTEGDLTVSIDVETELTPEDTDGPLHFRHAEFGGLTYGEAIVIDGAGQRAPVARHFDGESIRLTVPSAFLASATLPVTIDPVVTSWTLGVSGPDDANPSICYAKRPGRFFLAWEEYTSQTNADVYASDYNSSGSQGAGIYAVDSSNDHWADPDIAYQPGHDRVLVVASVTPDGPGTGSGRIQGRFIAPLSATVIGSPFFISSIGTEKITPTVGGTNSELQSNNHFLVAWTRILANDTYSLEYRLVDWDGTGVTNITIVDSTTNVRNLTPSVSPSWGDQAILGDYWTLGWCENDGSSIFLRGKIKAQYIVWSASPTGNGPVLTINNSTRCSQPSCGSRFDDEYVSDHGQPAMIAYTISDPSTLKGDIVTNVFHRTGVYSANLITTMEDFDTTLNQSSVTLGVDGRAYTLAYDEIWFGDPTGTDRDVYMCSGSIVAEGSNVRATLSESHMNVAYTSASESYGDLAMIQDGDSTSTSDDCVLVWVEDNSNPGGRLNLAHLDAATFDISPARAVGRQYCDATTHSGAASLDHYGPDSSFLWIEGTQSVSDIHSAIGLRMPGSVFASLNVGDAVANVFPVANSQGRLCIGGLLGRYTNNIVNSGTAGQVVVPIDPGNIPGPFGTRIAQPGDSFYFQFWHRDSVGGVGTSNFSNACKLQFTN